MSEEKNPIRNGIVIGVAIAFILYLSSFIPGLWHWCLLKLDAIWSYAMDTTKVGRWLIILLVIGCIPGVVLLIRFVLSLFADKGPQKSEYREDRFFGLVWRWDYSYGGNPTNIWCFCPTCDTCLVYGESTLNRTVSFTCELCQRKLYETAGDKNYAVGQAARQIDRKLRNGEWIQGIKPKKGNA